ncbi:MAG: hypothetical protein NUV47_01975 [Patescibacteria group bacterium]|nr:hypothetical protein [Patescibacteria group bacterium]
MKRINITLPKDTLELLDSVALKGDRSRLVHTAVQYYIRQKSKNAIKALLQEAGKQNYSRDIDIARDWFAIDEHIWKK